MEAKIQINADEIHDLSKAVMSIATQISNNDAQVLANEEAQSQRAFNEKGIGALIQAIDPFVPVLKNLFMKKAGVGSVTSVELKRLMFDAVKYATDPLIDIVHKLEDRLDAIEGKDAGETPETEGPEEEPETEE